MCRDEGGEHGRWGGEGSAGQPDGDQADHHAGPAVLGGQRPHYGLPPVDTEREGGHYIRLISPLCGLFGTIFLSLSPR